MFLIFFCCTAYLSSGQPSPKSNFIDPTGTYILKGEKQKGEIVGNFGEIRVKLIEDSLLAFTMYWNKGYPEYTPGSLTDTVAYTDNKAVHSSKSDPSCQIQFAFDISGLHIKMIYTDPVSNCGFEKGVLPLGFIEKASSSVPVIQPINRPK
jgi:hypothetical protein